MSIAPADLIFYSAASMPTDDVSTSGGAIDTASRPSLTQFSASAIPFIKSDGADVRTVTIIYRDAAGVQQSVGPITLNGATEVTTGVTAERILRVTVSTTSGTRTVTVLQGTGGTVRATVPINETVATAMFIASASSPSGSTDRYEKQFAKNTHGTLTLTGSTITLTADPSSRITIGGEAALDGSQSVANRLAVPGSVTFVDDGVAQALPSSGNLAAGSRIGIWIKQTLPTNDPAAKSTFTVQLAGNST